MKSKLLFTILTFTLILIYVPQVQAQADEEASSEGETSVTESIKDRLQKVVEEKKDLIKGVTAQGQIKRGFVASVKRVSEESITLETRQGPIIIPLDENLTILQDGKAFKASNLEIDSQVTVLGFQTGEDFEARQMLVHKNSLTPTEKFIEIGTLTKLDRQSLTLTNRKGEEKVYAFNKTISYEDNSGQTLKVNQVTTDQDVVILFLAENESSKSIKESVGRVFKLRTLSTLEEATPTASTSKTTPTPTKKASASPTKKPTATPAP